MRWSFLKCLARGLTIPFHSVSFLRTRTRSGHVVSVRLCGLSDPIRRKSFVQCPTVACFTIMLMMPLAAVQLNSRMSQNKWIARFQLGLSK